MSAGNHKIETAKHVRLIQRNRKKMDCGKICIYIYIYIYNIYTNI